MPLLKTIITQAYSLAIWQMSETKEDWAQLLHAVCPDFCIPGHLRSEKQRKEFFATRLLLHALMGKIPDVSHTAEGKPFLTDEHHHISLSHSASLAAAILSPFPTGIDTEETTRRIESIAPRFLSVPELEWTLDTPDPGKAQIFCWSAKEAIYKMMDQPGTDFSAGIFIPPTLLTDSGTTSARFTKNEKTHPASLHFLFSGNNVVTWCVYDS